MTLSRAAKQRRTEERAAQRAGKPAGQTQGRGGRGGQNNPPRCAQTPGPNNGPQNNEPRAAQTAGMDKGTQNNQPKATKTAVLIPEKKAHVDQAVASQSVSTTQDKDTQNNQPRAAQPGGESKRKRAEEVIASAPLSSKAALTKQSGHSEPAPENGNIVPAHQGGTSSDPRSTTAVEDAPPAIKTVTPKPPIEEGDYITPRPITFVWALHYMKALYSSTHPSKIDNWLNVRVLGDPPSATAPESVVEALRIGGVVVEQIVALDLGWTRGEWMVKIADIKSIGKLRDLRLSYEGGFLLGGCHNIPEIEFVISALPRLITRNKVSQSGLRLIPVVLMGIPFYDSDLDLGRYLLEAITAQNKALGIELVVVKQRYMIAGAQTNDVRCHLRVDPRCLHNWDFEKSMKLVLQGWDNKGVPRPEMWPVTMRTIDECLTCGQLYHYRNNPERTLLECQVSKKRDILIKRREASQRQVYDREGRQSSTISRRGVNQVEDRQDSELPSQPSEKVVTTSIGFIVKPA